MTEQEEANAAFVCFSRADVPKLLTEVRRLRALERAAGDAWAQTQETIKATD